ncbi:MAG: response regulator [Alphaproteobacteria bacterium]|nr:MAG: response regulator [Alphaproteobacteria bacterium]
MSISPPHVPCVAKPLLAVVDDQADIGAFVIEVAEGMGFDTHQSMSAAEYFDAAAQKTPDVLVLDIVMPEMDGIELVNRLEQSPHPPLVILMSGYAGQYIVPVQEKANRDGLQVIGTLEKPFRLEELQVLLTRAMSLLDR